MPIDKKTLISKFLNPETVDVKSIDNIRAVSKLPISAFNFFEPGDVKLIKRLFNTNIIRDFCGLHYDDPFYIVRDLRDTKFKLENKLEKDADFEDRVKKAVLLSLVLRRIEHDNVIIDEREEKVIAMGLDNAGKTSILRDLGGRGGLKALSKITPTMGLDRREIKRHNMKLFIWDFGGQADYRDKYLSKPQKYFFKVNLLIYVIDIQDPEKYDKSIEYFEKVLNILVNMEEEPEVLVFLHKLDPDIEEDTEILLRVEILKERIIALLKKIGFSSEIYLSSVYTQMASTPNFLSSMKEFLDDDPTVSDPSLTKIHGLQAILDKTINSAIRLSMVMEERFKSLNERLDALESGSAINLHQTSQPSPIFTSLHPPSSHQQKPGEDKKHLGEFDARAQIMSELRELIAEKKSLKD